MVINLRDVPEELARKFKAGCANRGETIKAGILRLMAEQVKRDLDVARAESQKDEDYVEIRTSRLPMKERPTRKEGKTK